MNDRGLASTEIPNAPQSGAADGAVSASGSSAAARDERPVLPPLRILLAEDNPVIQDLIRRVFEGHGHSVTIANNGREAVAEVRRSSFDAVLMDIRMPEMDGIQATAAIRAGEAGQQRTPIIVMTADSMSAERARCLAADVDGYVLKPVRPTALIGLIARCLDKVKPAEPAPS